MAAVVLARHERARMGVAASVSPCGSGTSCGALQPVRAAVGGSLNRGSLYGAPLSYTTSLLRIVQLSGDSRYVAHPHRVGGNPPKLTVLVEGEGDPLGAEGLREQPDE